MPSYVARIFTWVLPAAALLFGFAPSILSSAEEPLPFRMTASSANFALIFPTAPIRPGSEVEGLIQFYIEPGWHLYWKNPGDTGFAPTFDWQLPPGITIKDVKWPTPSRLERNGIFFYGYEKMPAWIATIAFDKNLKESTYPITLSAFWLACDGTCVPGSQVFESAFTVVPFAPPIKPLPEVIVAKEKLPIPISGGKASIDNDRLLIQLPLQEKAMANLEAILLFPETQGIISTDQIPVWKRSGNGLEISIPCLPSAKDHLIDNKKLDGLVQLLSSKQSTAYSFSVPYEPPSFISTVPPEAPLQTEYKSMEVSKELTAFHAAGAMKVILLMAFLGGILLNITPCVLPVVGLKILNLISLRNIRGLRALPHGLLFTLGVLITFWALAGALYLFEFWGYTMGWGFQLQEPLFVIALTILLFCFALALFGIFEMGTSLSAWASQVQQDVSPLTSKGGPSLLSSFASGILATLIATPCTGPLLGSVLGFASTFEPLDGFILFTALGLGVAFPFLIITAFPFLLRLFPRPGPWMITVRQFLGFCLLATIIWLLWVLQAQTSGASIPSVFAGLTLIAFSLWIFGKWGTPIRSFVVRSIGRFFTLLFFALGVFVLVSTVKPEIITWAQQLLPEQKTIHWEVFSQARLDEELEKGNTVFVEFTAKWCLTCQVNKVAFLDEEVVEAFEENHIVPLLADWTNGDPSITKMLRSLGRNGVPVYAIFKKGEEPKILPEIITPAILISAVSTQS